MGPVRHLQLAAEGLKLLRGMAAGNLSAVREVGTEADIAEVTGEIEDIEQAFFYIKDALRRVERQTDG